ncbi:SIMPL domain-containing protein [Megasphaera hexanoica]|uniref:SIMPL domain-containing protein n=1 Tax=Megasphaera sp. SW808 TaxID=2530045 RepID=UPI00143C89EB|nr:SIMPL domain-containing protein [Megasphaera sp. SW808]MDN0045714.1 SIMPL domain-containing protein [Megasphaera hexanoica]NJE33572.1 DUF541 domain-containing protein [Megasphaera sp. SW808]
MTRTITVRGVGKATAKADFVTINMSMKTSDMEYDTAMDRAAEKIDGLSRALKHAGFGADDLKTTKFRVDTAYDTIKDRDGNYKRIFEGFVVHHDVRLQFDFESRRLSQALSAMAACISAPEIEIRFSVKDSEKLKDDILRSAAENARRSAEILCEASGASLGALLSIHYSWDELSIYSSTRFSYESECLSSVKSVKSIDMEPEDIHAGDSATFVWEIC